jgi:phage terminase small subunit
MPPSETAPSRPPESRRESAFAPQDHGARDDMNETGINATDRCARPEAVPATWRLSPGESETMLYIYGPKAAAFEAPPADNPEPAECDEELGETLTARQLAFCERYVEMPVAARAAREAGYAEATAAKQAARLLKHSGVMCRILELRRRRGLEQAYRRETLLDKLDVVFAQAVARNELYAAIQALTMQARLARIQEAMPGFRYMRASNGADEVVWDMVTRLEQKLTEITVGDFPGAAAAIPTQPFEEGARAEAVKARDQGPAEQRAAFRLERRPRRQARGDAGGR